MEELSNDRIGCLRDYNGKSRGRERNNRERHLDMESELNEVFHWGQQQVTAIMFDLLEAQLHACVSTQTDWKNIGTEKRSVMLESGNITYRRHIYKDKQGKRHKPFDDLLHLRAYQRNSKRVEVMAAGLAAISSFRNAAEMFSYIIKEPVSASSIHRMTARVGEELQAIEAQEDARNLEPGKIIAPRLAAEADGVFIKLQGEKAKRAEVKVALFYTGKQGNQLSIRHVQRGMAAAPGRLSL